MRPILISKIIEAVGGRVKNESHFADGYISDIGIDSRNITKDMLFVAIKGENFDGHNFIQQAFEGGAKCVISEKEIDGDGLVILVKNSRTALRMLAEYYKSLFNISVVAITGTVGKTTTKELVSSVLSEKYNVLSTAGNFNNEIGLPLTVFRLEDEHDVLVVEMGMSGFGEIDNLSKIVKPNICIITNIGEAHIEMLGSKAGILKAKTEILNHIKKTGTALFNGDDPFLKSYNNEDCNIEYFGTNRNNDYLAENIVLNGLESVEFEFSMKKNISEGKKVHCVVNEPGKHIVYNALAAIACGIHMHLSQEEISRGLASFKNAKMRMEKLKMKDTGATLINDAYNSSPTSLKASIDILKSLDENSKKVLIVGDMYELGSHTKAMHAEMGEYLLDKKLDKVLCTGKYSKHIYDVLHKNDIYNNDDIFYFEDKNDIIDTMNKLKLNENDVILVKASRGVRLEEIVAELKE